MHLAFVKAGSSIPQSYPKSSPLTRPDSLASIFRRLRQNRCLTRATLAARYGCSEDYVCAVEVGLKFPSLRYYLFCAEVFGANPSWVKSIFHRECVARYSDRLRERLGLVL